MTTSTESLRPSFFSDFVASSRTNLDKDDIETFVVMGNQSGDSDSIVSALVHAFHLSQEHPTRSVVPLINFPRRDLSLRTDTVWLLTNSHISAEHLLFIDEVNLSSLHSASKLRLVLTDHNRLAPNQEHLAPSVVSIIDHHVDEHMEGIPATVDKTVAVVGSACSLVAQKLLQSSHGRTATGGVDPGIASLLTGVILLDTMNLEEAMGRVTPLDTEMVGRLLPSCRMPQETLYKTLVEARQDCSTLSAVDLLRKDYKAWNMQTHAPHTLLSVGISSVMQSFSASRRQHPAFLSSACAYAREQRLHALLVMFAFPHPDTHAFTRELLLLVPPPPAPSDATPARCGVSHSQLFATLVACLAHEAAAPAQVRPGPGAGVLGDPGEEGGHVALYGMSAVMSRKKLQPLLSSLLLDARAFDTQAYASLSQ